MIVVVLGGKEAISYSCAPLSPASHMIGREHALLLRCAVGYRRTLTKAFTPRVPTTHYSRMCQAGDAIVTQASLVNY